MEDQVYRRTLTAIVEFPDDKILQVRNGTLSLKDSWALPAGRVDVGENAEQSVVQGGEGRGRS